MPVAHFLLILAICAAWGGNFLASAVALKQIPPFAFTALRLGVVLACLLPWLKPIPRGQRARVVAIALLNGALHFGLNFVALRVAGDISSVAIALQSYIPMSALFAVWFLGERIGWRTGAGIAVAFAGVMVLGFDPLVLDAPAALLDRGADLGHGYDADAQFARRRHFHLAGVDSGDRHSGAAGGVGMA